MLPAPQDLQYFVEVASSLNISRAAERLGIAQPSLTLAMKRLEDSIGVPLLVRSKKGVTLTPAGRQLLSETKKLLQIWEEIRGKSVSSQTEIKGRFSIGVHPSVALYALTPILGPVLNEHSEVEIELKHDHSRKITEAVIKMEVDLGIVVNPVRHGDLVMKKIYDDEVTVWVGPGKSNVQNYKSGDAVLICDPALLQTQDLLQKLKRSAIHYKRTITSSNLEVITDLVSNGAGIGILPGHIANRGLNLKRIPEAPSFKDQIFLISRIENRNIVGLQTLIKAISQTSTGLASSSQS
ncbi:MAG: LysR family transcriptional regulator [Pseudobdellovibrionaceae bacterium]